MTKNLIWDVCVWQMLIIIVYLQVLNGTYSLVLYKLYEMYCSKFLLTFVQKSNRYLHIVTWLHYVSVYIPFFNLSALNCISLKVQRNLLFIESFDIGSLIRRPRRVNICLKHSNLCLYER